jgi:hypothetical protein
MADRSNRSERAWAMYFFWSKIYYFYYSWDLLLINIFERNKFIILVRRGIRPNQRPSKTNTFACAAPINGLKSVINDAYCKWSEKDQWPGQRV